MKRHVLAPVVLAAAVFFSACGKKDEAPAGAGAELAQKRNCLSCHAVGQKIVGPSYKDVAARYKGQADAAARLAQKISKCGAGAWGVVPMPANPQVSDAEAAQLVQWILTLE